MSQTHDETRRNLEDAVSHSREMCRLLNKRDYEILSLKRRIAELEAIVGRLPKYEDTGEAFVHCSGDECWAVGDGRIIHATGASIGRALNGRWQLDDCGIWIDVLFFFTPEAAKEARDEG